MNERRQKLEHLFHAALELNSATERECYLAGACAGDENLRREVDELLSSAQASERVFKAGQLTCRPAELVPTAVLAEKPGDRIGRYKLLEKIGEGGMGVVHMAEQEEPVRRRVALKIIRLGMDTRSVVARFEAERQALAMMDHPNIAKVLDGGATETGRPYFVMELVQGVPITEFCDQNKLSATERIKLFIFVCQAIQSAHQKGIIHRDIKPSNVLVTLHDGVPVPKVIDFGVAKATNQKLTEKTLFTNFATMIGTPAYMSPEQAEMSGLDVDTRSDIYSLGVLLYELLTGTTPFPEQRLRSVAYNEMQRIIVEEEPERPSTRLKKTITTAATAGADAKSAIRNPQSEIDSDLDWIVMKCLEKDRNRRYATANGLAADIQRHLNDDPVVARPPSVPYRLQKFILRNKLQFAAGTVMLTALIVAVIVSTWQAVLARKSERKARAITDFLVDELLKTNPFSEAQADPGKKAFAERAVRALEGRFPKDPLIEAELRLALWGGLSTPKAVIECEKALAIRQRLLGEAHSDTLSAAATLAQLYLDVGRKGDAEKLLARALAAARSTPGTLSRGAAEVVFAQGILLRWENRPADALPWMKEGLSVLRHAADPKDWRYIVKMGEFAFTTTGAGKTTEAEKLWNELVEQCARQLGSDNPMTAQALNGKAYFLLERGRWREAQPLLQQIIPIYERVAGTNNPPLLDSEDLLARSYEQAGDIAEAAKIFSNAYPRWTNHFPYHIALKHCQTIGNFFARHGDYAQARQVFGSLREWFETHPPDADWTFELFLAATAATKGWPAAGEVCRKNLDRFSESMWIWLNKAWIFCYLGDEEHYQQVVRNVLALAPSLTSPRDQHLPIEIAALGLCPFSAEQQSQLSLLVKHLEVALPQRETDQQVWGYRAIGQLQLQLGHFPACLSALEKAAAKQTAPDPYLLLIKANCLHHLKRHDEARAAFDEGEKIMKSLLSEPLSESEAFLSAGQIYQQLLMRREVQALLGAQPQTRGAKP